MHETRFVKLMLSVYHTMTSCLTRNLVCHQIIFFCFASLQILKNSCLIIEQEIATEKLISRETRMERLVMNHVLHLL